MTSSTTAPAWYTRCLSAENFSHADENYDETMKAAVFERPGRIVIQERPIPDVGPTDALLRVTLTTICGTDVHILKGEYPVAPGRVVGHEPVGVIERLGNAI